MAAAKKGSSDKTTKTGDKNKAKAKGDNNSGSKNEKANGSSNAKMKAATAINPRHILVRKASRPFFLLEEYKYLLN